MEHEQNESSGESFDPINTEGLMLSACPYLGLAKDPHTSIAFPHRSNLCHASGTSRKIDLAHQSGYCLSGRHEGCHRFKQPVEAPPPGQSRPDYREPVSALDFLPSTVDDISISRPRLESFKLRLLSFRLSLLLFRLRLRARMPAFSARISALSQKSPRLNQALSSPSGKLGVDGLNANALKQADLRLFAIPAMILLILLAAIIWWPPPGESEKDAVAVGAPIAQQSAASDEDRLQSLVPANLEELQPAGSAASRAELPASETKPVSGGTADLSAQTEVQNGLDAQDDLTDTESLLEDGASVMSADATVIESDAAIKPLQNIVETVQDVEQVVEEEPMAAAQIETESVDTAESAPAPAEAALETTEPDILPVGAVAFIGPASSIENPTEIYDSQEPLLLHSFPAGDAQVVARIFSEQPAAILGRDSSGEWILVRLNGNIQGWANAALSGIDIPVDGLPAMSSSLVEGGNLQTPAAEQLPAAVKGVVNIGALNVRAGPGIEYESISVVYNKDEVSLLAQPESNGWVQVRLPNGLLGWLNSNYLILPG